MYERVKQFRSFQMNERHISVIAYSLFSSWMLAFLFEGQMMLTLAENFSINPINILNSGTLAMFAGLLLCGSFIKNKTAAKQLFTVSIVIFIVFIVPFFFSPSILWTASMIINSFLAGSCTATWAFYLKSSTPRKERIKAVADLLILSNLLMIPLNTLSVQVSPYLGLVLSIILLLGAFVIANKLPEDKNYTFLDINAKRSSPVSIIKPLGILCLFVGIITINSGLMYRVINPAFAHLERFTSWYWAVPYVMALFVMRNLPSKIHRSSILYTAISMLGLSFIAFVSLDRSVASYLIVNTLMLGACGVYDLFWWSILSEMLEFGDNPAKILGTGLSANVFGIILGGRIGDATERISGENFGLLALTIVFITLALLPPLHKNLLSILNDHIYLSSFLDASGQGQIKQINIEALDNLSKRESQVASLLLEGKTYKAIAEELYLSENTIRTHVKNLYSKCGVQNRMELVNMTLRAQKNQTERK